MGRSHRHVDRHRPRRAFLGQRLRTESAAEPPDAQSAGRLYRLSAGVLPARPGSCALAELCEIHRARAGVCGSEVGYEADRLGRASTHVSSAVTSAASAIHTNATLVPSAPSARKRPSMSGPTKPPSWLSALIQAIPPAAAAPERNAVGKVQNTASHAIAPAAIRVSASTEITGAWPAQASISKPTIDTSIAPVMCQRRSPVRSELFAQITIAPAAKPHANAVTSPTFR